VKTDSIKIGVVGLGTVGAGVVRTLKRNRAVVRSRCGVDLEIAGVADINAKRLRATKLPAKRLFTDYVSLIENPDIDIIVELIGGDAVAYDVVNRALRAGKHVVTANKALMAKHWRPLHALAARKGCALAYESSVMAGVPVIRGIREGLAGNRIESILAILNGTSNYILTQMARERISFDATLADAQRRGFCEANASLDIDGYDAAQKLSILGSIALGKWLSPEKIYREGIGDIEQFDLNEAREEFGYVLRPLAIFKQDGYAAEARVHPTFVPRTHPLASIEDEFNAILVNSDTAGAVTFAGRGAGEKPAASGVVSDVIHVATALSQSGGKSVLALPVPQAGVARIVPMKKVFSKYYLRFSVVDRPGVFSFVSGVLGKKKVSIASCHQRGRSSRGPVAIVMITHHAREGDLRQALAQIDRTRRIVKRKTVAIRIED